MLAKSIIAGTVLSLMAGGVVYFGTDIDTEAVKDKVVQKTADMKAEISDKVMAGGKEDNIKTETSVDTPSVKTASGKIIEGKKPTISYSTKSEKKVVKAAEPASSEAPAKTEAAAKTEAPAKKWLDQYLKTEKKSKTVAENVATKMTTTETETPPTEKKEDVAKDLLESMGLTKDNRSDSNTDSVAVKDKTDADALEAEAKAFEARILETENIWIEKKGDEAGRKKATRKMLRDIIKKDHATFIGEDAEGEKKIEIKVIANEDGETTIETETIDMGDGKVIKIVKNMVKSEDGPDQKIYDKDISETVEMVMTEIQKIEKIDLRDRAYFSLICFGLDHKRYDVAGQALENIKDPELRDQGRTHIAVAYAKAGQADKAWDMLDTIEIEASRDVMRLEIIQAIIAPQAPH